jgi:protein SCO1/2
MRLEVLLVLALLALGCGTKERGTPNASTATATTARAEHEHAARSGHEGHGTLPSTGVVPDTSLFLLTSTFTDEESRPFRFDSLAGKRTLMVMVYGSCETICPTLLEETKRIDASLTPAQRDRLRVIVVTFDPERDTPERLVALAAEKGLERPHFRFLRGSDADIRELATVLGVQYRRLEDGNFSHSAVITLLETDGRIIERIEGLGQSPVAVLTRLQEAP